MEMVDVRYDNAMYSTSWGIGYLLVYLSMTQRNFASYLTVRWV